jgi:hypothetical protein
MRAPPRLPGPPILGEDVTYWTRCAASIDTGMSITSYYTVGYVSGVGQRIWYVCPGVYIECGFRCAHVHSCAQVCTLNVGSGVHMCNACKPAGNVAVIPKRIVPPLRSHPSRCRRRNATARPRRDRSRNPHLPLHDCMLPCRRCGL